MTVKLKKTKAIQKDVPSLNALERLKALSRERFATRAAHHDREASFPYESFKDLIKADLHGPAIPKRFGGQGLGPIHGKGLDLWNMTMELARSDMALARCWEGHINAQILIDGCAEESQKKRWFRGIMEEGDIWAAWSGEPPSRSPNEKSRFGTTLEKVQGGYKLTGTKIFCSGAPAANWAILFVSPEGPGGARHATGSGDALIMLACAMDDPTISRDSSWWDPIGMRGSVSYLVRFDGTFIPDDNLIGQPGQFLRQQWQTRFIPQYASTFLGAAKGAYAETLNYIHTQKKGKDPYIQQHLGQMACNIETGYLWLEKVDRLWREDPEAAMTAGSMARHVIEHLAEDTLKRAIRACGARALNRPCPIERIYRDLSFYVRHDNDDHNLATIGQSVLGERFDASFFTQKDD